MNQCSTSYLSKFDENCLTLEYSMTKNKENKTKQKIQQTNKSQKNHVDIHQKEQLIFKDGNFRHT